MRVSKCGFPNDFSDPSPMGFFLAKDLTCSRGIRDLTCPRGTEGRFLTICHPARNDFDFFDPSPKKKSESGDRSIEPCSNRGRVNFWRLFFGTKGTKPKAKPKRGQVLDQEDRSGANVSAVIETAATRPRCGFPIDFFDLSPMGLKVGF